MSIASESKHCPKCGAPIPAEAPQGLCPKCLLQEISIPTDAGQTSAAKPAPPSREELVAAFPHLEILELIGQGGMGFVFKARQPKLDRFVALKILPQSLAADPAFAERFSREGRLLARLNHPNIVTVHDFGVASGLQAEVPQFFYLLMEYVDGVNLRQAMRAGRFTPDQALAVVPKICEALQFAHNEGILHRDIKPENILLDTKGRVKIADFGIAKLVGMERGSVSRSSDEKTDMSKQAYASATSQPAAGHRPALHGLTSVGKTLGTPNYMAPEQIEKPGEVDHRADIYSLGVVFYEMLTGELPRGQFAPPSQKSAADPRLDDIVLRALEREPNRRTQSAGEVKTQVETIATNQSPSNSKSPNSPKPKKFAPYGLMVGSWVFILVVLLTTVITFLLSETYDAFARVKVEMKIRPGAYDPFWLQTQFEIIRSDPILTAVVQDLKLTDRWSLRSGDQKGLTLYDAVDLLRHSMLVRQSRNTSLIEIHAFSESPKEAAEIANAIAHRYAAYPQDDAGKIEIVDRATPPSRPVKPNKLLNIAIGILGGIVLGALAGLITTLVLRRKHSSEITAPTPSSASDRFWKRFAVAVALVLLALILIPVFAILLAIAVPAFQRARQEKTVPYLKTGSSNAKPKAQEETTETSKSDLITRSADPTSALQFRLVLNNSETNVPSDVVTNYLDASHSVPLRLSRNILLDGKAVKAAGRQTTPNGDTNFVMEFTEEGSRQFEALTANNVNQQIAVIFQGHILTAPVINSRIHTSTLNFPVNWSQKDLERTMNGLNWMHHRAEDLRFGPKQENVLPPLKNKWVFLNLRKNRLATNSYPDVESRAFHDWQRENGADLAATLSEKTPFLLGYGVAVVPAPANGLDNNSPTDIWYNWDLMANEPQLKSHLIKNPKTGQDTYFFRTRDDTWGVLQIVGFCRKPAGCEGSLQAAAKLIHRKVSANIR